MKTLLDFINESMDYERLGAIKLNNNTIDAFINYATERLENEEDPDDWNKFDNILDVFKRVCFYRGVLYNGYLDSPFNFEIKENKYTFKDAYDEILGALAIEDESAW